jgi:hypothetical protein
MKSLLEFEGSGSTIQMDQTIIYNINEEYL